MKKLYHQAFCEECKKGFDTRSGLVYLKGKTLCLQCRQKLHCYNLPNPSGLKSINKVLSKIYTPRINFDKKGRPLLSLSFPRMMLGRKFKIVLVENKR